MMPITDIAPAICIPFADSPVAGGVERGCGEEEGEPKEDVPRDGVNAVAHRGPLPGEEVLESRNHGRVDMPYDGEQHEVHGHREAGALRFTARQGR
jgi:hypothetical protein